MGHEDHAVMHGMKHLMEAELFGDGPKARALTKIIKEHALLGAGVGFIPVPLLDIAAIIANTWGMYVRINEVIGISFTENVLRSIASGVIANVASVIPGAVVAKVAGSLLKLIPGLGTVGGIAIDVMANVAIMYVMGKVYVKSLCVLAKKGDPLTEDNLRHASREVSKDKEFVKAAYVEGKDLAKHHKDQKP